MSCLMAVEGELLIQWEALLVEIRVTAGVGEGGGKGLELFRCGVWNCFKFFFRKCVMLIGPSSAET